MKISLRENAVVKTQKLLNLFGENKVNICGYCTTSRHIDVRRKKGFKE